MRLPHAIAFLFTQLGPQLKPEPRSLGRVLELEGYLDKSHDRPFPVVLEERQGSEKVARGLPWQNGSPGASSVAHEPQQSPFCYDTDHRDPQPLKRTCSLSPWEKVLLMLV